MNKLNYIVSLFVLSIIMATLSATSNTISTGTIGTTHIFISGLTAGIPMKLIIPSYETIHYQNVDSNVSNYYYNITEAFNTTGSTTELNLSLIPPDSSAYTNNQIPYSQFGSTEDARGDIFTYCTSSACNYTNPLYIKYNGSTTIRFYSYLNLTQFYTSEVTSFAKMGINSSTISGIIPLNSSQISSIIANISTSTYLSNTITIGTNSIADMILIKNQTAINSYGSIKTKAGQYISAGNVKYMAYNQANGTLDIINNTIKKAIPTLKVNVFGRNITQAGITYIKVPSNQSNYSINGEIFSKVLNNLNYNFTVRFSNGTVINRIIVGNNISSSINFNNIPKYINTIIIFDTIGNSNYTAVDPTIIISSSYPTCTNNWIGGICSGKITYTANTLLTSNVITNANILIQSGVYLSTNGFSILTAGNFMNLGTIDTLVNLTSSPIGGCTNVRGGLGAYGIFIEANVLTAGKINANGTTQNGVGGCGSFGAPGGGGGGTILLVYGTGGYSAGTYNVIGGAGGIAAGGSNSGSDSYGMNGGNTLATGGLSSYGTTAGNPGTTPSAPTLTSSLIGTWWNSNAMFNYLEGAGGGVGGGPSSGATEWNPYNYPNSYGGSGGGAGGYSSSSSGGNGGAGGNGQVLTFEGTPVLIELSIPSLSSTPSPSATLDIGQSVELSSTEVGQTSPFTYNYLISYTANNLVQNSILESNALTSNSVYWYPNHYGFYQSNVVLTDAVPTTANSTYLKTYTVNNALIAGAITPTTPSLDTGQSLTLTANPSGGTTSYSYKWYTISGTTAPTCTSANLISGATSSTYTASPTTTNSYAYQVTDSATTPVSVCSSGTTITVHSNPTITLTVNPATQTYGTPATINAIVSGGSGSFSFSNTMNNVQLAFTQLTSNTASYTLTNPYLAVGSYQFNVIATDNGITTPLALSQISNTLVITKATPVISTTVLCGSTKNVYPAGVSANITNCGSPSINISITSVNNQLLDNLYFYKWNGSAYYPQNNILMSTNSLNINLTTYTHNSLSYVLNAYTGWYVFDSNTIGNGNYLPVDPKVSIESNGNGGTGTYTGSGGGGGGGGSYSIPIPLTNSSINLPVPQLEYVSQINSTNNMLLNYLGTFFAYKIALSSYVLPFWIILSAILVVISIYRRGKNQRNWYNELGVAVFILIVVLIYVSSTSIGFAQLV